MPDYQLTQQAWLNHHLTMLSDLLPYILHKDTVYSAEELLAVLRERGLNYSNPDYLTIGPALIVANIIEPV